MAVCFDMPLFSITVKDDAGRMSDTANYTAAYSGMAQERQKLETENQYLSDFIRWMHLENSYLNFTKKAYPERDEYGFGHYTYDFAIYLLEDPVYNKMW